MSFRIDQNGVEYKAFESATIIASIGAVTRGFTFQTSADEFNLSPVKVGDEIKIYADNIPILGGYVDSVNGSYEKKAQRHSISINGRSYLADLVDSSLPTAESEYEQENLVDICLDVMENLGLEPLVTNNAGTIENFEDLATVKIGTSAFKFLSIYAQKRQVLITSDGFKTLILTRAGTEKAPGKIYLGRNKNRNNVERGSFTYNDSERFNKYFVQSQLDPLVQSKDKTPQDIAEQGNVFTDEKIRKTRRLELQEPEEMDNFLALDRATWEANIRKANALKYDVTLAGHSVDGKLWLPNTLVEVEDIFADIKASLLIKTVKYVYSAGTGSTVDLSLTYPNAFTLELEAKQRQIEKVADEFGL